MDSDIVFEFIGDVCVKKIAHELSTRSISFTIMMLHDVAHLVAYIPPDVIWLVLSKISILVGDGWASISGDTDTACYRKFMVSTCESCPMQKTPVKFTQTADVIDEFVRSMGFVFRGEYGCDMPTSNTFTTLLTCGADANIDANWTRTTTLETMPSYLLSAKNPFYAEMSSTLKGNLNFRVDESSRCDVRNLYISANLQNLIVSDVSFPRMCQCGSRTTYGSDNIAPIQCRIPILVSQSIEFGLQYHVPIVDVRHSGEYYPKNRLLCPIAYNAHLIDLIRPV